uniref:Insulin-like domain-containing protein n=1 Tax=Panagrolaimus sp. JU765 TaxID=591449 RepID=A0AC34QH63_9BILA
MNAVKLLSVFYIIFGIIETKHIPSVVCGHKLLSAMAKACTMKGYTSACFGDNFPNSILGLKPAFIKETPDKEPLKSYVARMCCSGQCSETLLKELCCSEVEFEVFKLTHKQMPPSRFEIIKNST